MSNRIWKWYKRHNNAVNAVLDIACGAIPGAGLALGAIKLALARIDDEEELAQDEKALEAEKMLEEIEPMVRDVVEDIEHLESFRIAGSDKEKRQAIERDREVQQELQRILPQLSQSIVRSVSRLEKRKVLGGRYQLAGQIGGGGQAQVYRGMHIVANRPVAVKIFPAELSQDATAIAKLRHEYDFLVGHLVHENIVQYRDLAQDEESGSYFVVMDLIDGDNLRVLALERRGNPLSLEEVVQLLMPVAQALDFAHEKGIVHRDLKPENIITRSGDQRIYLTDFGLASEVRTSLSQQTGTTGDISGTLPYMAPEQYLGRRVDGRTDNWALGVMVYELVEGVHPFAGTTFEHYMKLICEVEPEEPERIDGSTWQVLQQMLAKERKARPQRAVSLLEELLVGKASVGVSSPAPQQVQDDDEHTRKMRELERQIAAEREKTRELQLQREQREEAENLRQQRERELKAKEEEVRRLAEERKKEQERLAEIERQKREKQEEAEKLRQQREQELKAKEEEARRLAEQKKKEQERLAAIERQKQERAKKVRETSKDGRYEVSHQGVIYDTKTKLEWYVGPDEDIDHYDAEKYVQNLTVAGGGWRLPSIDELQGICAKEKNSNDLYLDPVFKTTGWCVWSGEFTVSSSARFFPFLTGNGHSALRYSLNLRVFGVRPGRR